MYWGKISKYELCFTLIEVREADEKPEEDERGYWLETDSETFQRGLKFQN